MNLKSGSRSNTPQEKGKVPIYKEHATYLASHSDNTVRLSMESLFYPAWSSYLLKSDAYITQQLGHVVPHMQPPTPDFDVLTCRGSPLTHFNHLCDTYAAILTYKEVLMWEAQMTSWLDMISRFWLCSPSIDYSMIGDIYIYMMFDVDSGLWVRGVSGLCYRFDLK